MTGIILNGNTLIYRYCYYKGTIYSRHLPLICFNRNSLHVNLHANAVALKTCGNKKRQLYVSVCSAVFVLILLQQNFLAFWLSIYIKESRILPRSSACSSCILIEPSFRISLLPLVSSNLLMELLIVASAQQNTLPNEVRKYCSFFLFINHRHFPML